MDTHIFTLHHKGTKPLRAVADRFRPLALFLPPVWTVLEGLWLTLAAQIGLAALAWQWSPLAVSPVVYGIAIILALEGGTVARTELHLRGWREVGVVEARTAEGAEELYLNGEVT